MQLLVKDYLQDHSLAQLEEEHGVKARFNTREDKFSLNYDQIKVKNGNPIAEQCRGLVLRPLSILIKDDGRDMPVGDVDVLAWPLDRFYNLGQECEAPVDWSDPKLRVFEKLDGTMCILYWDPKTSNWDVATRSVPEADLPFQQGSVLTGDEISFADLFWRAFQETLEALDPECITGNESMWNLLETFDKDLTYVFELTTPMNRVVVRYDCFRVTLLAARNIRTGYELVLDNVDIGYIPKAQTWASLNEPRMLSEFVNNADPAKLEGCVVLDSYWRRVKVKNKAWVLSSKAKDLVTVSRRNALAAIIDGTVDDVIPLVEETIADKLREMQAQLAAYIKVVDKRFLDFKTQAAGDRKLFAHLVTTSGDWPSPYFQLLDGKGTDMADWLQNQSASDRLTPGALESLLKMIQL
jgi:hypothetical protein